MSNSAIFLLTVVVVFGAIHIVAVVVHEAGHLVAARMLTRIVPTRLRIGQGPLLVHRSGSFDVEIRPMPIGGAVHYAGESGELRVPIGAVSWEDASPKERLIVSLAGPLAHASTFALTFWLASLVQVGTIWLSVVQLSCIIEIAAAFLSLLPGPESDGGHVYRSLRMMPADASDTVLSRSFQCAASTLLYGLTALMVLALVRDANFD